jgi:iron complex transport system ATP-binding protein
VLEALDLHAALGGRTVLRGIRCALEPARWVAVLGPNGAGKSSLLRVFAGLLKPLQGEVRWQGENLQHWPARRRAREIAWLAQSPTGLDELTVAELVMLGRLPHLGWLDAPGAADCEAAERAMQLAECKALQDRRLGELSGGEHQRALLARALAVDAPVLLLDEPSTFLDPPHQAQLARVLRSVVSERGALVVSVLHDLNLALMADELLVLDAGGLVDFGATADVVARGSIEAVFGHCLQIWSQQGRYAVTLAAQSRGEGNEAAPGTGT